MMCGLGLDDKTEQRAAARQAARALVSLPSLPVSRDYSMQRHMYKEATGRRFGRTFA